MTGWFNGRNGNNIDGNAAGCGDFVTLASRGILKSNSMPAVRLRATISIEVDAADYSSKREHHSAALEHPPDHAVRLSRSLDRRCRSAAAPWPGRARPRELRGGPVLHGDFQRRGGGDTSLAALELFRAEVQRPGLPDPVPRQPGREQRLNGANSALAAGSGRRRAGRSRPWRVVPEEPGAAAGIVLLNEVHRTRPRFVHQPAGVAALRDQLDGPLPAPFRLGPVAAQGSRGRIGRMLQQTTPPSPPSADGDDRARALVVFRQPFTADPRRSCQEWAAQRHAAAAGVDSPARGTGPKHGRRRPCRAGRRGPAAP